MNSTGIAKIVRFLFTVAAVLALVAVLVIILTPGGYSVTTEGANGEPPVTTTETLSFYEMQGAWGIIILFIFSALYYGPVHFYNLGRKGMTALFGFSAIMLTALALFSIGAFYSLSALLVLIGLVFMPFDNM
jgi:hypothetical protein